MKLFTLCVSYSHGNHYCGVYPSLEYLYGVIQEMVDGEDIPRREIPKLKFIKERLDKFDDFWWEFVGGTWIQIQVVELIKKEARK